MGKRCSNTSNFLNCGKITARYSLPWIIVLIKVILQVLTINQVILHHVIEFTGTVDCLQLQRNVRKCAIYLIISYNISILKFHFACVLCNAEPQFVLLHPSVFSPGNTFNCYPRPKCILQASTVLHITYEYKY